MTTGSPTKDNQMGAKSSLGFYSVQQLAELGTELDKRVKSGDALGVTQIVRICHRFETDKNNIQESKFGRMLFSLAKDWRSSDRSDKMEAAGLVRTLIDDWKIKYFGKVKKPQSPPETADVKPKQPTKTSEDGTVEDMARVEVVAPKTGVPARDRIRQVFCQTFADFAVARLNENKKATSEATGDIEETKESSAAAESEIQLDESPAAIEAKSISVGLDLEYRVMKHFPDQKSYQTKARSLIFNLKDVKNVWLRASLYDGTLDSEKVVKLEAKELASEQKKAQRESSIKHELQARRTDWAQEKARASNKEGFFKCHKCGSKKTSFYQMQTRGADEPMTNFVNCHDCGKRWKC